MACNYRWRGGEIDVIAEKESTLVCAEVKTWNHVPYYDLERAVNARKRHTIITASKHFLKENPRFTNYFVRYDLLFLEPETDSLRHVEDAFQETGAV